MGPRESPADVLKFFHEILPALKGHYDQPHRLLGNNTPGTRDSGFLRGNRPPGGPYEVAQQCAQDLTRRKNPVAIPYGAPGAGRQTRVEGHFS